MTVKLSSFSPSPNRPSGNGFRRWGEGRRDPGRSASRLGTFITTASLFTSADLCSFEAMAKSATSKFFRHVVVPRSIAKCSIVLLTLSSIVIGNPYNEKPHTENGAVKNEGFDYEYSNNRYMVIPQDYDSLQLENETIVELLSTSVDDSTAEQSGQQHKLPDRPRTMRANRPVRQQQSSWFSLWSSGKREFSLTGLLESMVGVVTGGLSSIVNNVIGNESKGRKTNPSRVSYKGHQLLRINPVTKNHLKDLLELRDFEAEDVRFWTQPVGNRSTDILISPDVIPDVKDFLREKKIDFTVLIPDLQKTIAYQNPKMSKEQRNDLVNNQGHSMTWKRYHRFGEILKYVEYLAFRYPHLVELITIGHSFEGQPLKVVKVSSGLGDDLAPKPAIWIDAGMHAREWISTAVATYILSQLVEKNTTYSKLLDTADWMILPVANPDGYEFSHTGDRLWRKTRSNHADNDNEARYTPTSLYYLVSHYTKWLWTRCDGVDPNRNFGYHWGEDKEGGMSGDPCHETYAGPSAFSEPETKAMAEFIMANRENIRLYLTLHSYSQMWLVPWGHTHSRPDDYSDLANVAKKAAKATAKVYGTNYKVGPSADLLYPTTGASDDWAKGVAGIKYSYTLELRDRGTYGFLLPATQIIPTARETWAGIRTMARLVTNAGT